MVVIVAKRTPSRNFIDMFLSADNFFQEVQQSNI